MEEEKTDWYNKCIFKYCFKVQYLFTLCFCLIIICIQLLSSHKDLFWGDAGDYYALGKSLWNNNSFSLLNMSTGFRGYVYPLYLGVCDKMGGVSDIK